MSKDLSKVKAGDFVKYTDSYGEHSTYGIVIKSSNNDLVIIHGKNSHMPILTDSSFCKDRYEYRRINNLSSHYYKPDYWKEGFEKAKDIFAPKIEIELYINGKQANLSDISEETLIKLRNEN